MGRLLAWGTFFSGALLVSGCGGPAVLPEDISAQVAPLRAQIDAQAATIAKLREDLAAQQAALAKLQQALREQEIASRQANEALRRQFASTRTPLDNLPIELRLKSPITLEYSASLEDLLDMVATTIGVPLRIAGEDLKEEGISRIRILDIKAKNTPADEVLARLMLAGNVDPAHAQQPHDPGLKLVYVISKPSDGQRQEIVVTTRRRAEKHGHLPAMFVVAK